MATEKKWQRHLKRGSQSLILTVAVLGILILINVLVARYPWRWDATEQGRFTLAPQTVEVLDKLEEDVTINAFLEEGSSAGEQVRDLLDQYSYRSPHIKLQYLDPLKQPSLAQTYEIKNFNTVILASGEQQRRIEPYNLFAVAADGQSLEFRGEQALTRSLLDLTQQRSAQLYFLEGHGEGALEQDFTTLKSYLEGDGYTVQALNLAVEGKVPDDASMLIAGGPQRDLQSQEEDLLNEYLNKGGQILLMQDPSNQELASWQRLAEQLGVALQQDVVVDQKRAFFYDPVTPVAEVQYHEVTSQLLDKKLNVILPRTRSLQMVAEAEELQVTPLLKTSPEAWGETNLQAEKAQKDDQDLNGPLTLAVAVEKPQAAAAEGAAGSENQTEREAPNRLAVVVGNSTFVRDVAAGLEGNIDFFVNAANWLLGEDSLITIRPKENQAKPVQLSAPQLNALFLLLVAVVPVVILILGGVVWWRRRSL